MDLSFCWATQMARSEFGANSKNLWTQTVASVQASKGGVIVWGMFSWHLSHKAKLISMIMNEVNVLQCPSQSPDQNSVEELSDVVKWAIYRI